MVDLGGFVNSVDFDIFVSNGNIEADAIKRKINLCSNERVLISFGIADLKETLDHELVKLFTPVKTINERKDQIIDLMLKLYSDKED